MLATGTPVVTYKLARNRLIVKILQEYFPTLDERSKVRVLDLAAGTGLIGQVLSEVGFANIDAVGKYKITK